MSLYRVTCCSQKYPNSAKKLGKLSIRVGKMKNSQIVKQGISIFSVKYCYWHVTKEVKRKTKRNKWESILGLSVCLANMYPLSCFGKCILRCAVRILSILLCVRRKMPKFLKIKSILKWVNSKLSITTIL